MLADEARESAIRSAGFVAMTVIMMRQCEPRQASRGNSPMSASSIRRSRRSSKRSENRVREARSLIGVSKSRRLQRRKPVCEITLTFCRGAAYPV